MKIPRVISRIDRENKTNYDDRSKRGEHYSYRKTERRLDFQTPIVTNENDNERVIAPDAPDSRELRRTGSSNLGEVATNSEIDRNSFLNSYRTSRDFPLN